jgi:hypothetical protein
MTTIRLEQARPRHRRVLYGEAIDVVERLQLFAARCRASCSRPMRAAVMANSRATVDVAGDLQRVFRAVR